MWQGGGGYPAGGGPTGSGGSLYGLPDGGPPPGQPQQGGYAPQQTGYPPQQVAYAPPQQHGQQQGGYPQQQSGGGGGFPPQQQGGYPLSQQGGYPPPQQGWPQQGYPPAHGGGYPPQQGAYPPQQQGGGGYLQGGGYAPQQQGGYPPQQQGGAYAPQQPGGGYALQQQGGGGSYLPQPQGGYAPQQQQGGHAPHQGGYAPQQGAYVPQQQQGGYAQQGGHAPQGGSGGASKPAKKKSSKTSMMLGFVGDLVGVDLQQGQHGDASFENLSKDEKIARGLTQALEVGMDRTVELLAREDGYYRNEAVKVMMPEKLKKVVAVAKKVGLRDTIEELVLSMNRAAERAAVSSLPIFKRFIKGLHFSDVLTILNGRDDAATQFFKGRTERELTDSYTPIVKQAIHECDVTRHYQKLAHVAEKTPFLKDYAVDIERYTITKALAGLFHVLADQERQIRKDPMMRTTQLLKDVFGMLRH